MIARIFEALIIIAVVIVVCLAVVGTMETGSNYKTQCQEQGGEPVFNGKHWECWK